MSLENAILSLASAINRLADAKGASPATSPADAGSEPAQPTDAKPTRAEKKAANKAAAAAPAKAAPAAAPAAPGKTIEDCRAALMGVAEREGRNAPFEVLSRLGCGKLSEVPVDQYGKLVELCEARNQPEQAEDDALAFE